MMRTGQRETKTVASPKRNSGAVLGKYLCFILLFVFFAGKELSAKPYKDFDWFWVFYEKEVTSQSTSLAYRPFYLSNSTQKGLFQASLMPLLFWRYKTDRLDSWHGFFGFFETVNYTHKNGINDYDFSSLPFFFYGDSVEKKDKYLLVWPVGGTIKGKLGFEKITAWGFPWFILFFLYPPASLFSLKTTAYVILSMFPVYASYEYKDYKGWSFIWPLIHRGKSLLRDELRIFPFYSKSIKKGWYERYSYMLIYNYQRMFFRNDILETLFIFPFYGHKRSTSGRRTGTTVLWPFFSWGYDKKNNDRVINMPWPFVQIQDCDTPKIKKRIFFPFYGLYRYQQNETFFITPLYFSQKSTSTRVDAEDYMIGIIFWYFKRQYKGKPDNYYGSSWRYVKVWPLLHIEYNDVGDFSFNLLSILPFRDEKGYEKLYQPFWSLVEYRRLRDGEQRLGILLRFYFQRWGYDFLQIRIPFILTYEEHENKLTELSFLFSMFAYVNKEQGRYMRLFWIPIRIGESNGKSVPESSEDRLYNEISLLRLSRIDKPLKNEVGYSYRF